MVAFVRGRAGQPYRLRWLALAAVVAVLSFDEYASLHETFSGPFRDTFGGPRAFYFGWVVPGTVFVAAVAALSLPFLATLGHRTRRLFVLAGAIYVTGALGLEFIEGVVASEIGEENWP